MLARWQFWVATIVALVTALLAVYTMTLFGQNRVAQAEFARRTQLVAQNGAVEAFYRDIVKALAELSVRNKDQALADLLAKQGITVNAPTEDSPAGASAPFTGPAKP